MSRVCCVGGVQIAEDCAVYHWVAVTRGRAVTKLWLNSHQSVVNMVKMWFYGEQPFLLGD